MKLRLQLFFDSLRYSYMTVPMLISLCGLALALLTLKVDAMALNFDGNGLGARVGNTVLYSGGADGARALLGAIAGSIISVAALASSIAITALALASGQFGSRLLRTFMDDRGFQIALGTFNGTFLFCLVVLRAIRSADEGASFGSGVPQVSVTAALALAVMCVFLLIYFLHHMAQAIQAPYVIADAAHDLNVEIERLFGAGKSAKHGACASDQQHERIENEELPDFDLGIDIEATREGFLRAVNYDVLLRLAIKENAIFKLGYGSGDWVVKGDPLLTVWPPRNPMIYQDKARGCFVTGRSRTTVQDAEYGFNQLVEVGARALLARHQRSVHRHHLSGPYRRVIAPYFALRNPLALFIGRRGQLAHHHAHRHVSEFVRFGLRYDSALRRRFAQSDFEFAGNAGRNRRQMQNRAATRRHYSPRQTGARRGD